MRWQAFCAVATVPLLLGCLDPSGDNWQARGVLREGAGPGWAGLNSTAATFTEDQVAVELVPPGTTDPGPRGFLVTGMTFEDCEAFVAEARQLATVQSVRECERSPAPRPG